MDKIKPKKVRKIHCPKCKELMMKLYPWSSFSLPEGLQIPNCVRCINIQKERVVETPRIAFSGVRKVSPTDNLFPR